MRSLQLALPVGIYLPGDPKDDKNRCCSLIYHPSDHSLSLFVYLTRVINNQLFQNFIVKLAECQKITELKNFFLIPSRLNDKSHPIVHYEAQMASYIKVLISKLPSETKIIYDRNNHYEVKCKCDIAISPELFLTFFTGNATNIKIDLKQNSLSDKQFKQLLKLIFQQFNDRNFITIEIIADYNSLAAPIDFLTKVLKKIKNPIIGKLILSLNYNKFDLLANKVLPLIKVLKKFPLWFLKLECNCPINLMPFIQYRKKDAPNINLFLLLTANPLHKLNLSPENLNTLLTHSTKNPLLVFWFPQIKSSDSPRSHFAFWAVQFDKIGPSLNKLVFANCTGGTSIATQQAIRALIVEGLRLKQIRYQEQALKQADPSTSSKIPSLKTLCLRFFDQHPDAKLTRLPRELQEEVLMRKLLQ